MTALNRPANLTLPCIACLLLAVCLLWTLQGPAIASRLTSYTPPPHVELLPAGQVVSADIPARLAEYLALVNLTTGTSVDTSTSHGVRKHGADAIRVRSCLDNGGGVANLEERDWGYILRVCLVEEGKVGLQVLMKSAKGWKEVTAYILSGNHTVKGVIYDLLDAGASLQWSLKEIWE